MNYESGQIRLFGNVRLYNPKLEPIDIPGKRERDLIIALAVEQGKRVSRDSLTSKIWDRDDFQARKTLNTALWRLRKSVREAGVNCENWFETGTDFVRLREKKGPLVDCVHVRNGLAAFEKGQIGDQELCERLLLVKSVFLEGLEIEWAEEYRYIFETKTIAAFLAVIEALGDDELGQIIEFAQQAVKLDPFEERAWRALIEAYFNTGQRAQAHACYQRLCSILDTELGIEPSVQTKSLFHFIETGGSPATNPISAELSIDARSLVERIDLIGHSLSIILCELETVKIDLEKI